MRLSVDLHQVGRRQVSVLLGRGETGVSEELLDRPEVRSVLEKVSREGMPETVGCQLAGQGRRDPGSDAPGAGHFSRSAVLPVSSRRGRRCPRPFERFELGRRGSSRLPPRRAHRKERSAPCRPCRRREPNAQRARKRTDRPRLALPPEVRSRRAAPKWPDPCVRGAWSHPAPRPVPAPPPAPFDLESSSPTAEFVPVALDFSAMAPSRCR